MLRHGRHRDRRLPARLGGRVPPGRPGAPRRRCRAVGRVDENGDFRNPTPDRRIVRDMDVELRHNPSFAAARVSLAPGEKLRAESGAMMATSYGVDIKASTE